MNTIIIVVSIGKRHRLTKYSLPRVFRYAANYGYSVGLITNPIQPSGMPPHYAKLKAPSHFPGFSRYCIIDDDILLNPHAPALPDVPSGHVGLVPDAVQDNTENKLVQWTGNTGFLLFGQEAIPLLETACSRGDEPSIWGFADQGALNYVLWEAEKAYKIDSRWNFAPVIEYFHNNLPGGWNRWVSNKIVRVSYFFNTLINPFDKRRVEIKKQWGVHLIRAPYTSLFHRIVPFN